MAGQSSRKRRQLVEEPSTLVYTLNSDSTLPYEHFSLMIKSLHSYMVDDIIEHKDKNVVHVKLLYQASVKNAKAKLGRLASMCSVSKMSAFIKDEELSLLDTLRRQYGLGGPSNEEEEESSPPRKIKKARSYLKNSKPLEEESGEEYM